MTTNFVYDDTNLTDAKSDRNALPIGEDPTKWIVAVDWNTVRQALLDVQGWARGANWLGLTEQSGDPAPSDVASYLYLGTDGKVHVNSDSLRAVLDDRAGGVGTTQLAAGAVTDAKLASKDVDNLPISVKNATYGAVGDWNLSTNTGTDDRAAFVLAIAAAISSGKDLRIPPGVYHMSKYLDIHGVRGLKILGSGFATIHYNSDDLTVNADSTAISNNQARSAFLLRNCSDVVIENVAFWGGSSAGSSAELSTVNVGAAIYATKCSGMRIRNCTVTNGGSPFAQDATGNTGYTSGNSLAVSAGIVTIANAGDPNGAFDASMVGRMITVVNATNPVNNGVFRIQSFVDSTHVTYANAAAIAEGSSSLVWSVNDGDSDTLIDGCRFVNCRHVAYTGSGGTWRDCKFTRPMTHDISGIPDSFTLSSTTVTLSDATGSWPATVVGKYIKIAGATTSGNNGIFKITAVTPLTQSAPATLTYTNASGATELAPRGACVWWIAGGEKVGLGNGSSAIASSSGVVTFTASSSMFEASDVRKILVLTDCTTVANNGAKVITRYISATQVQYVQSDAVSETYAKVFTVDGYDNAKGDQVVGVAISSTTTSVAANTLTDSTLTMVTNAYAGRFLTDHAGANWEIATNTGTAFTLLAGGATPATGTYTVTAGSTHGSTHGIYYFGGRSNIKVRDCQFYGVRTTGVKASGSSAPIRDIDVSGNTFIECGAAVILGADDQQEHSAINIHHNRVMDCSLGRTGWNDQQAMGLYGSRNSKLDDNQFHASHDCIQTLVNGGSIGGFVGVFAGRYLAGISQPCEDVSVSRNTFTVDPNSTVAARVAAAAIHCEHVGQRAKYRTGGTLTKSGSIMTLTDSSAEFSQQDVGSSIQICFAPDSGNNSTTVLEARAGDWTVTGVSGSSTLTFVNSSGVGGGVDAGTYRIKPKAGAGALRGGMCTLHENSIGGYGGNGIETLSCVAPDVVANIFNGCGSVNIAESGSVAPHIARNRELGVSISGARITITTGTSWPVIYDNFVTNGALTADNLSTSGSLAAARSDMGVGVGSTTAVDYPLLGKRGRAKVTGGHAELMFAFGSDLVDGDTLACNGVACTYKASSPGAHQFNDITTLISLLGTSGMTSADYGAQFSPSVTTGHIRTYGTATTASADAYYIDTINALNETALVIPRNAAAGSPPEAYQNSRGEGDAGPVSRRLVVWSMCNSFAGGPHLTPDNAAAAALARGGWYPEKAAGNGGCCEVFNLAEGVAYISSSSTATGVNTLTDSGQTMTTNAYAGYWLTDSAGAVWLITSNTATVFTLTGSGATPTGGAYTVAQNLGSVGSTAEFRWAIP